MLLKNLTDKLQGFYQERVLKRGGKLSVAHLLIADLFALVAVLFVVKIFANITDYLNIFFSAWKHTEKFHDFTGQLCYILCVVFCFLGILVAIRAIFTLGYIATATPWMSCTKKTFVTKQLVFIAGTMMIFVFVVAGMAVETIGYAWNSRSHGFHFRAYGLNFAFLSSILWGWWSTTHYRRLTKCRGPGHKEIVEIIPEKKDIRFIGLHLRSMRHLK